MCTENALRRRAVERSIRVAPDGTDQRHGALVPTGFARFGALSMLPDRCRLGHLNPGNHGGQGRRREGRHTDCGGARRVGCDQSSNLVRLSSCSFRLDPLALAVLTVLPAGVSFPVSHNAARTHCRVSWHHPGHVSIRGYRSCCSYGIVQAAQLAISQSVYCSRHGPSAKLTPRLFFTSCCIAY